IVKEQADHAALLRCANRFVRQQQRSEIMQRFAFVVNFIFASGQFPGEPCQLNYLIRFAFGSPPKQGPNYSKPLLRYARAFEHFLKTVLLRYQ
ncbi:hypothetical protein NX774_23325, partial [Massilia agilis]